MIKDVLLELEPHELETIVAPQEASKVEEEAPEIAAKEVLTDGGHEVDAPKEVVQGR